MDLAIAATALHRWPEALRAWRAVHIDAAEVRDGQLTMPPSTACVRLNPQGDYGAQPTAVWEAPPE